MTQYIIVGPTCEGGTIAWSDAANAWVVTPNVGVTEVAVAGLPEGAKLAVKCGGYAVPSAAFVGFGEGKTEGVFSLALDEKGVVTIGGEEIPVKPTILLRQGYGGQVGDSGVSVTMRAIPGLRYELRRRETLSAPVGEGADGTGWDEVGEPVVATGTRVTLTDTEPPKGQAFYRIVVKIEEF